jgi:serine protease Do
VRAFAALLLAGTALGGAAGWTSARAAAEAAPQAAAGTPPIVALGQSMPSFADLVARVRPAVVTIISRERPARAVADRGGPADELLRRFFGLPEDAPPPVVQALGSGFVIDADGRIVTNNHVVDGATAVTVKLDDGRALPARVVGRDPRTDLALLQVDAGRTLPHLDLGDSSRVRPGDWVVAMGNPFGLGGTVTAGIVSARGRDIGAGPYDDFLQIDAPINQGNSGGPLFAMDGTVVGVNTAILSPSGGSVGIGFAIPSDMVRRVVAELEAHGRVERGWRGVTAQSLDPAMAAALRLPAGARGALVDEAQPGSPAAAAGLRPGDVVTAVDGKPVASARDLARIVGGLAPGSDATLAVRRDGRDETVRVAVAELREARPAAAAAAEKGRHGIGVALQPLTPEARGALVAAVEPGSPAAEAGLRPGDVITAIGTHAVSDPAQAVAAIQEAERTNEPRRRRAARPARRPHGLRRGPDRRRPCPGLILAGRRAGP